MIAIFSIFRTLSLRYIWQHRARSLLIVLSIALGVATLISTQILSQCLELAASQSVTPLKGAQADLFIDNGEVGVHRSLAAEAAKLPGVATATPLVFERVIVPELDRRTAILLGSELTEPTVAAERFGVKLTWTLRGFPKQLAPPVFIGRALADARQQRGIPVEDPLKVRIHGRDVTFLPVGILDIESTGPGASLGRNVLAMEIGQACRVLQSGAPQRPDLVTRIDVFLEPEASLASVRAELAAIIGSRAMVRTPEMQGQATNEVVGGIRAGFTVCAIGAMVVGMFLVYNALSVSVTERRHEIGILRSLGATRFQVAGGFAVEAMFLGLIGALVGLPLGDALAQLALSQIEGELRSLFLRSDVEEVHLSLPLMLLAMAAGMLTALGAALVPAIQAANDQPADAVRRAPKAGGGFWGRLHQAACALLIGVGLGMVLLRDYLPGRAGTHAGMALFMTGLLLAMPLLVTRFAHWIRPVCRWLFGIETRLAADNLIRSPGRTGVVIGAFGAGVALMFQIAGVGRSNEEPVMQWLNRVITADLVLFGDTLAAATSSTAPLPAEFREEITALEGVEEVIGIRYIRPEFAGTRVFLIALDAVPFAEQTERRSPIELPNLHLLKQLPEPNTVLVSQNFAVRYGVRTGDTIRLPTPSGKVSLRVCGEVIDYSWNQGSLFMDRAEYARLFQDPLVDVYHVFLETSATPEQDSLSPSAGTRVRTFAEANSIAVADRQFVWDYLGGLIQRVYQLAYLQEIIVGVVASLGIVTALLISVLQRRREIGLLRAVGATRGQILRSVLAEAILMGVLGTILGILIGLPLEWFVLQVVLYEESGFLFDVLIPWTATAGIALGAFVVSCLAGLLPAFHAMNLNIPEAIAYE